MRGQYPGSSSNGPGRLAPRRTAGRRVNFDLEGLDGREVTEEETLLVHLAENSNRLQRNFNHAYADTNTWIINTIMHRAYRVHRETLDWRTLVRIDEALARKWLPIAVAVTNDRVRCPYRANASAVRPDSVHVRSPRRRTSVLLDYHQLAYAVINVQEHTRPFQNRRYPTPLPTPATQKAPDISPYTHQIHRIRTEKRAFKLCL